MWHDFLRWHHSAGQLGNVVTEDFGTARYTIPNSNPHETLEKTSTRYFWQNQTTTSLQPIFHEIQKVSLWSREMHVWSVLTTSFLAHLFWTSVPCIIGPELRDASVLVLCFLTNPSELVVYFVRIITEVRKFES